MRKARKIVDMAMNSFMVVMFAFIFGVVLTQIFYRYVLRSPLVWTEELSRYTFIWVSLVGWVMGIRSGTHIRITFFEERLPARLRAVLGFVFKLANLAFFIVLLWLGIKYAGRYISRGMVTIPSIPMGVAYASLPASAALGIFYLVYDFVMPKEAAPQSSADSAAAKEEDAA